MLYPLDAAAGMNSVTSVLRSGKPAVVQDGMRIGCMIGLAWLQLEMLRGHLRKKMLEKL